MPSTPIIKDSAYHNTKLQNSVKSRIPSIIFRLWDPLTTWLEATARRAAELSADIVQTANNFYIDSAQGSMLDRRLGANEGVTRLAAVAASDGTVTLSRQVAPTSSYTFPVGAISVSPMPDPSQPFANRPIYTNNVALTIGPGATSWTVGFTASTAGANTNMPGSTPLQLVSNANLFDTAVVAAPFTTGADAETDAAYRQRGKLVIRSRTLGTNDALIAAALSAGAYFAYTVENLLTNPTAAPTLSTATTGGSLAPGTYIVAYTYKSGYGETLRSPEATITVPAGTSTNTITVNAGSVPTNATQVNVYVTAANGTSGSETLQANYSIGSSVTVTSIAAGQAALPTTNSSFGAYPVTVYAADTSGALGSTLRNNIFTYLNGNPSANPPIPMARAKGIPVDVQAASSVTFNFTIKLILQSYVTGSVLTQLQTDLNTAITNYVQGLNLSGNLDRAMRINRVKDICMTFRGRGVMDVDDATFLPASSTTLTAQQMAVMGTITWL